MNVKELSTPLTEDAARRLSVGDRVLISGAVFTARDAVHQYLAAGESAPCDFSGAVIYHCGPVVVRRADGWLITAAGPTTSIREEPYMADLISRFGLRAIIGKGGMGARTLEACGAHGCVYLHAVGGAAQVLAATVTRVETVFMLERFGVPEAIWQLVVDSFPAVVTMDAHGRSLHADIEGRSSRRLQELIPDLPGNWRL